MVMKIVKEHQMYMPSIFTNACGSSWTIVDTEDVLGVNLNIKPKR